MTKTVKTASRGQTKRRPQTKPLDRNALVESIVAQVPFDGWTEAAYENGLTQAGIDADKAARLFPEGLRDVIEAFGTMADEAMLARMQSYAGFARLRVRDKVAFGVRARLEYLAPHRLAMRRLMAWYLVPTHAPLGLKRLAHSVDLIWKAAGDTATDYNYYTKRILLGAVVKATVLFWLSDESPDSRASWDFLDRRIAEVLRLGKSISLLKEFSPSEIGDFVRRKFSL